MEELFRKYCVFYAAEEDEKVLDKLNKKAGKNASIYQKKALKFIKNLKHKAGKLHFGIDFESFCKLLEEYIAKKDDLEDKDKKIYLKILYSLSQIYEINLREELISYISYKKVTNRQITERDVFKQFCLYNLNPNDDVIEYNRLLSICETNKLNLDEIKQKSIAFVEEIKMLTEKIGFTASIDDVHKMIYKYQQEKKHMTQDEKVNYLKLLLYLCELYNLNLRELIMKKNTDNQITELSSNPLNNKKLLYLLFKERYENGSFKIEDFLYNSSIIKEEEYNYNHELANLSYSVYQIFIDKITNYAYDDLNPLYSNMITEEDILRISTLKEEEIENILNEISKHESTHYICKKYKITENLYKFIYKTIYETMDLHNKSIGTNSNNLFNVSNTNNVIAIYLEGKELYIIKLLKLYIKKCIENNINYEMDGLCYDNNTFKSIIYSNKKEFKTKISYIEEILNKNEDIAFSLSSPLPFSCHKKDKIYSISRRKIKNICYIDYINDVLEVSYYRTIAKIIINKIDKKDEYIIEDFINLNNVSCNSYLSTEAIFNNTEFSIIKDTINNYIPSVITTINKYITDKEYQEKLILEFEKAILYISNTIEEKEKNYKRNITIE